MNPDTVFFPMTGEIRCTEGRGNDTFSLKHCSNCELWRWIGDGVGWNHFGGPHGVSTDRKRWFTGERLFLYFLELGKQIQYSDKPKTFTYLCQRK